MKNCGATFGGVILTDFSAAFRQVSKSVEMTRRINRRANGKGSPAMVMGFNNPLRCRGLKIVVGGCFCSGSQDCRVGLRPPRNDVLIDFSTALEMTEKWIPPLQE